MRESTKKRVQEAMEILAEAKGKIPRVVESQFPWMKSIQPVCNFLGGAIGITEEISDALNLRQRGEFTRAVSRLTLKAAFTYAPGREAQISEDIDTITRCLQAIVETADEEIRRKVPSDPDGQEKPQVGEDLNKTEWAICKTLDQHGMHGLDSLKTLEGRERPSTKILAKWMNHIGSDSNLKATLSSLVKRRILYNGRFHGLHQGYALTDKGTSLIRQRKSP